MSGVQHAQMVNKKILCIPEEPRFRSGEIRYSSGFFLRYDEAHGEKETSYLRPPAAETEAYELFLWAAAVIHEELMESYGPQ